MRFNLDGPWEDDVGVGWRPLVRRTLDSIKEVDPDCDVFQVKEKFGGLRIYVKAMNNPDTVYELIAAAEAESVKTCEYCGKPGKPDSKKGWIKTTCEDHR